MGRDPFVHAFVSGRYVSVDSWSFVHILTFICCGYCQPDQMWTFMGYGIFWELCEFIFAGGHDFWAERGINSLWDIWFNLLGYRIGEIILWRHETKNPPPLVLPEPSWNSVFPRVLFSVVVLLSVSAFAILFL